MKGLNLNVYGVSEMNVAEMHNVDGGIIGAWGWFWSGCKIGLGVGGAVGTAAALVYV
ncbi:hypothetical protein FACS1894145_7810 [Bacteroidia bacterium]|nr:hypothetical protein FACS1894145_7810 [Bacteroidia bacterium]